MKSITLTTMALCAGMLTAGFAADYPADEVVVYKTPENGEALALHIYTPENRAGEKRPCIVFFFGGGWQGGTPRQFFQQADYFRRRGMVAISAEYRTKSSHGVTPQQCVADAKSAIRWVRQNAAQLGVDPEKIIAAGGSAGGHVAACTGVIEGFEDPNDDITVSSRPQAMVLFNPVLDTTGKGYGAGLVGPNKTEISPCHQVQPGIPPTLIFHGDADTTVPLENAERFTRLMTEAGNPCRLVTFPGRKHGFFNGSFFRPKAKNDDYAATMKEADQWLTALGLLEGLPLPVNRAAGETHDVAYKAVQWLGASVTALVGEEYSAFGVSKEDGGIRLVEVPVASAAGNAGLKTGDVIQAVNGKPVKTATELIQAISAVPRGHATRLKVVRAQQVLTLVLPPTYHVSVPKPTLSNVRYGAHERQVLDFWKASSDRPTPLVFYIHGGSWLTGSKEIIHGCVDVNAFLKAGISVVAINYRYVSQAAEAGVVPPVKAPMYDAARALQFVRSKADEWNIDKARVGGTGASAGGCSTLWLAFHDDLADPDSDDPVARESTRLFCAAPRVPQTTLDPFQMKEWTPNSSYGGHAFGLGRHGSFAEFLSNRERYLPWIHAYSPYAHVSADDPPVCLFFNKYLMADLGQPQKDATHTANFGIKLQERCREVGVPCEVLYDRAPDVKHNEATFYLIETLM